MFIVFAACAQAPVPLSLVARVLGVQPDSRELDDIRNCALLSPPSMGLRKIETVSVHQVTRSVFMDLFLQDVSTLASKADGSFYNVSVCKLWQQFHAVAIHLQIEYKVPTLNFLAKVVDYPCCLQLSS